MKWQASGFSFQWKMNKFTQCLVYSYTNMHVHGLDSLKEINFTCNIQFNRKYVDLVHLLLSCMQIKIIQIAFSKICCQVLFKWPIELLISIISYNLIMFKIYFNSGFTSWCVCNQCIDIWY